MVFWRPGQDPCTSLFCVMAAPLCCGSGTFNNVLLWLENTFQPNVSNADTSSLVIISCPETSHQNISIFGGFHSPRLDVLGLESQTQTRPREWLWLNQLTAHTIQIKLDVWHWWTKAHVMETIIAVIVTLDGISGQILCGASVSLKMPWVEVEGKKKKKLLRLHCKCQSCWKRFRSNLSRWSAPTDEVKRFKSSVSSARVEKSSVPSPLFVFILPRRRENVRNHRL